MIAPPAGVRVLMAIKPVDCKRRFGPTLAR